MLQSFNTKGFCMMKKNTYKQNKYYMVEYYTFLNLQQDIHYIVRICSINKNETI